VRRARPSAFALTVVVPRQHVATVVAAYVAATWLMALTALNMMRGGDLRATVFFALPVCISAWYSWHVGFVVAAAAIVSAWVGGALPEPDSPAPLWADALFAFGKLSLDALVLHALGRRWRARAAVNEHETPD